jgi:hypothetical protein
MSREGGKNLDKKRNGNAPKQAFFNTTWAFKKSLPILMGVLMLLALTDALIPKQTYRSLFLENGLGFAYIPS